MREIGRLSRAKGQPADRLKPGYQKLLTLADDLLERARQLLKRLTFEVNVQGTDELGSSLAAPRETCCIMCS